ncbi:uncharacterized protein LOC141599563 [Silene latifolia]|uniref:uncharacterized protein LOC141599563 n=1 Tax=Silene latifolia TaxID=37657 RepID=UPI003D775AC6
MDNKFGSLCHLFVTIFLATFAGIVTLPAITDVTMAALCPGQDECSLAIYLSGFQQAAAGLGSVLMTPLIGNLSDVYGRKALLTLPLTLYILPFVVLAYRRETSFYYAHYVLKTLTSMMGEGTLQCLSLAYVADNISESKRGAAFGILAGVSSAAFVCGTVSARFLSTAQTFQVATLSAMAATVYMRIFLKETPQQTDNSTQPLLKSEPGKSQENESSNNIQVFKHIPSIQDIRNLLESSKTFSRVAVIVLFNSLAGGGLHASLMYFLKAQFHFSKDEYAYLMLIIGIAGMVSQLILMPVLLPLLGEDILLRIGLLAACTSMTLNSIAWDTWVIYAASGFQVVVTFTYPCLRSIASKQVGADEQGKAQGCISGIESLANIISPLIFSPLTAIFLSKTAPFYFPGFSLLCTALCMVIAFILSLMIKATPDIPTHKANNKCIEA